MLNNSSNSSLLVSRNSRLKIAVVAVACAFGACLFVAAASPLSPARRDATPEGTVQAMFVAWNKRDWRGVFSRIESAKLDAAVATLNRIEATTGRMPQMVAHLSSFTINGNDAAGHVKIDSLPSGPNHVTVKTEDDVTLRQTNGDWKIVSGRLENSFFNQLTQVARDPKRMAQAQASSVRSVVLSNLKQIALAVLIYTNDHDDRILFNQSTLKSTLKKYIAKQDVWFGPDGKPLDVRINPALVGKSIAQVARPAYCVLLSLGPKGNLQFTNDRTLIAFVDGHVKPVSRAGVANLLWK